MDPETNPQVAELLSQVREIHVPVLGWWPPAPGWWIVVLLSLAVITVALYISLRRASGFRWVTDAELELAEIEQRFKSGEANASKTTAAVSVLMRRSAIAGLGRSRVARATGGDWLKLVEEFGGGEGFKAAQLQQLVSAPYRAEQLTDAQVAQLIHGCRTWLNSARKTPRKADV